MAAVNLAHRLVGSEFVNRRVDGVLVPRPEVDSPTDGQFPVAVNEQAGLNGVQSPMMMVMMMVYLPLFGGVPIVEVVPYGRPSR